MPQTLRQKLLYRLINTWPPFLGAGIRVRQLGPTSFETQMKLTALNRNYVGTQFGGSLYSMCDPWFMLILMENLGPEFIVWDKEATIRFKKPGKGRVRARFEISREEIASLKERLKSEEKIEPRYEAQVVNDEGEVIAEVSKLIYIRRKDAVRGRTLPSG